MYLFLFWNSQEKKSGKVATKGQKQIVEENAATLTFYRNMSMGALAGYALSCVIFWSSTTASDLVCFQVVSHIVFLIL